MSLINTLSSPTLIYSAQDFEHMFKYIELLKDRVSSLEKINISAISVIETLEKLVKTQDEQKKLLAPWLIENTF